MCDKGIYEADDGRWSLDIDVCYGHDILYTKLAGLLYGV